MPAPRQPLPPRVRKALRREFTKFFQEMLRPEAGWPPIPPSEFVDALADSLYEVGKADNNGVALVQTLAIELQDRVNNHLTNKG